MRILGLDPGLRNTGWGIIDVAGNRLTHVADGVAHAAVDQPLASRLSVLFRQILAVLERFRPDEAAVEETFVNKNPASTLKLGVARGVVLLAPAERGLPVAEYSANLVKKAVVGAGHAEKEQVQMMVRRLLPGCDIAAADAAERDWFRLLTTVQGVGARLALAMLSVLSPDALALAIFAQDKASLARADGVGAKLAARIVNELRDKVGGLAVASAADAAPVN